MQHHVTRNRCCVLTQLRFTRPLCGKSAGPDQIPGRVLKVSAKQLTRVLPDIFNIFLRRAILVPKEPTLTTLNDHHPVAVTQNASTGLLKGHLTSILPPSICKPLNWGCHIHCTPPVSGTPRKEDQNTLMQMLFVDFSSAFNASIPQHLTNKPG